MLGGAAVKLYDYRRRLHQLERQVAELSQPKSKHDLAYLTRQDIGEDFLFKFVALQDDVSIMQTKLENFIRLAQHVAGGGKPDDIKKG